MMKRTRITCGDVIAATADACGMTREALLARTRKAEIVRPRHVAIYVARQLTDASFPALAKRFRYSDHTSIMYAVRALPALMERDPLLSSLVMMVTHKAIARARIRDAGTSSGGNAPRVGMAA